MSSKKKSILSVVIMLLSAWILVEGYLKPIPALSAPSVPAGSTREIHGGKEPGAHEAEARGKEGHGEKSWWRFPGWQMVFAVIGCLYFALVLVWLPLLVARKSKGEVH